MTAAEPSTTRSDTAAPCDQDSAPLLDEAMIAAVVDHFYDRVRSDPTLGPVFNGAVADWDDHLQKLAWFWSSVMLRSGRYKGNPVATHLRHKDSITPVMFDRWLALWSEVTLEQLPDPAARALQARAAMIAESLQLALSVDHVAANRAPRKRPAGGGRMETTRISQPYRSTPIFDESTLPAALRRRHMTKAGSWGVIRVLEGEVVYTIIEPPGEQRLTTERPGLINPGQPHFVTPTGPMRMQVEFYDHPPVLAPPTP